MPQQTPIWQLDGDNAKIVSMQAEGMANCVWFYVDYFGEFLGCVKFVMHFWPPTFSALGAQKRPPDAKSRWIRGLTAKFILDFIFF